MIRSLIQLRIKYHLTQKQLAKKLGCSESYISLIEKGHRYLTGKMLNELNVLFPAGDISIDIEEDVKFYTNKDICERLDKIIGLLTK